MWSSSEDVVHIRSKDVGNPPLSYPPVLACRMPHTTSKIKDCVFVEDHAHVCKLSKIGKYSLWAESSFQLLLAASLMTLFAANHWELMVSDAPSQKVEHLKASCELVESKVAGYELESTGFH